MRRLGPLPRRRASDAVYGALRSAILSKVFEPGQRLKVNVTAISPNEVAETFEIRAALECLAAELAVIKATDDEVASLRRLFEAMSATEQIEQTWELHDRRNRECHTWIVRRSRNRKLRDLRRQAGEELQHATGSDEDTP